MSKKSALRVAIGEPNGRRSSTWRVWFGSRDVFAAMRMLGGTWKVSIHYPRPPRFPTTLRYIGFTKDYVERRAALGLAAPRRHVEFKGYEFAPGFFMEARFVIPESELRPLDPEGSGVLWVPPPPIGMQAVMSIISAPPEYRGNMPGESDGGQVECLLDHEMDSGRRVWVASHIAPAPPLEPYRQQIRDHMKSQGQDPRLLGMDKNTRVALCLTFEDGCGGFAELAADFL